MHKFEKKRPHHISTVIGKEIVLPICKLDEPGSTLLRKRGMTVDLTAENSSPKSNYDFSSGKKDFISVVNERDQASSPSQKKMISEPQEELLSPNRRRTIKRKTTNKSPTELSPSQFRRPSDDPDKSTSTKVTRSVNPSYSTLDTNYPGSPINVNESSILNFEQTKKYHGMVYFEKRRDSEYKPPPTNNNWRNTKTKIEVIPPVEESNMYIRNYDYKYGDSKMLMFIPDDLNVVSQKANKSVFKSFNELARTSKSTSKLENLLKMSFDHHQSRYQSPENSQTIDKLSLIKSQLEYNKSQKEMYKSLIKKEREKLVLPLIEKEKQDFVKRTKMPPIRVLPSRKLYYAGNLFDALLENRDKVIEMVAQTYEQKQTMNQSIAATLNGITDQLTDPTMLVYKFFWYVIHNENQEWRPDVREGHTFTACGKHVVLYGGISGNLMGDICIYDPSISFIFCLIHSETYLA